MRIQGRRMLALLGVLISTSSFASIITIEPDDYGVGADLSNVSPYVSIQWVYGTARDPILAAPTQYGASAPTGDLTFGYHPFGFIPDPPGSTDLDQRMGLGFFFSQPTDHVSLLTLNDGYPYLGVEWGAFDQYGNLLEYGWVNGGASAEAILADIHVDDMWTLLIGGHDSIAGVSFDHLVFDVPEPTTLSLFALGVIGLIWNVRRLSN